MMLGRGTHGDKQLLIIGLSKENLRRLPNDPILVRREAHGGVVPEGWEILILTGDTEPAIAIKLRAAGMLGPHSDVKVDPRLESS